MLQTDRTIVSMSEVDAAGIIYYATPLRWAEKLLTQWLHGLGRSHRQMFSEGIALPAVNVNVDYRSHLSLDDDIRLELTAAGVRTTAFTLRCEAFLDRSPEAAVEVRTTHVYTRYHHPSYATDARTVKQPMPEWLREALAAGLRP